MPPGSAPRRCRSGSETRDSNLSAGLVTDAFQQRWCAEACCQSIVSSVTMKDMKSRHCSIKKAMIIEKREITRSVSLHMGKQLTITTRVQSCRDIYVRVETRIFVSKYIYQNFFISQECSVKI